MVLLVICKRPQRTLSNSNRTAGPCETVEEKKGLVLGEIIVGAGG